MSIFRQLSKELIKKDFTHKGLLLGVVPIYLAWVDPEDDDDVIVCERNGIPEIAIVFVAALIEAVTWLLNFGGLRPAFPSKYPIIVTGEL